MHGATLKNGNSSLKKLIQKLEGIYLIINLQKVSKHKRNVKGKLSPCIFQQEVSVDGCLLD
jgi:hypothetical protein